MITAHSMNTGPARVLRADAAMAGMILLLGSFLAVSGNGLVQRWQSASLRQQSLAFDDQLGITANLAGAVVILWWALSLVIAFMAALLERAGRTRAASAAARFSPGFMRRLALAAVGLQLITAQLATAAPLSAPPGAGPGPGSAVSTAWVPAPDAPSETGSAPVPDQAQWRPLRPIVEPGPLAPARLRSQEPAASPGEVTVRAGDSLWSLSAAQLGPFASDVEIAAAWPRLYQENRHIIGRDPGLLLPGQVLRLPPPT